MICMKEKTISRSVDLGSLVEDLEDSFVRYLLAYGIGEQEGKEYFYCEELSVEEEALMDAVLALKERTSEPKEAIALCPNGCGTPLVKQKFVEVYDDKMQPHAISEALFCSKCRTKWLPEVLPSFLP